MTPTAENDAPVTVRSVFWKIVDWIEDALCGPASDPGYGLCDCDYPYGGHWSYCGGTLTPSGVIPPAKGDA